MIDRYANTSGFLTVLLIQKTATDIIKSSLNGKRQRNFVKANGDVLKRRYENESIHGIGPIDNADTRRTVAQMRREGEQRVRLPLQIQYPTGLNGKKRHGGIRGIYRRRSLSHHFTYINDN